jgi:hypothetical protein
VPWNLFVVQHFIFDRSFPFHRRLISIIVNRHLSVISSITKHKFSPQKTCATVNNTTTFIEHLDPGNRTEHRPPSQQETVQDEIFHSAMSSLSVSLCSKHTIHNVAMYLGCARQSLQSIAFVGEVITSHQTKIVFKLENWIILFYGILVGLGCLRKCWSIVLYVVESLEFRICLRLLRLLRLLEHLDSKSAVHSDEERDNVVLSSGKIFSLAKSLAFRRNQTSNIENKSSTPAL